jgi:hypothetical protein
VVDKSTWIESDDGSLSSWSYPLNGYLVLIWSLEDRLIVWIEDVILKSIGELLRYKGY